MVFQEICTPALIYIIFSLTQIVIDTFNGMYNTAFMKAWVAIIFTILLNYLCSIGLGVISWFIVFIPFILMSLIISILLLVFGLDPSTGKTMINVNNSKTPTLYQKDVNYLRGITTGIENKASTYGQDISQYISSSTSDIENKASTYGQDISQYISSLTNQTNNLGNGTTTSSSATTQNGATQNGATPSLSTTAHNIMMQK
jgi:predicted PurR-regulated permease PerM